MLPPVVAPIGRYTGNGNTIGPFKKFKPDILWHKAKKWTRPKGAKRMFADRSERYLHEILKSPGKWFHLTRQKRKNNFHTKSDEKSRKESMHKLRNMLDLLGIKYEVREKYFIRTKENDT